MPTTRIKKPKQTNQKNFKKVIFLLPGELFSNNFLRSWTKLLLKLPEYEITPDVHWTVGTNIYKIRNDMLMGKNDKGPDQKPFQGKLKYDYIMWIDSDQVFTPEQFKKLLNTMEKNNEIHILSGIYLKDNNRDYTSVVGTNHPEFPGKKAGFIVPADIRGKTKLIEADFTGMGFMLVRYGVFESLSYPWFLPIQYSYLKNTIVGFTSEDASFCKRARDKGFKTYIDPALIIGHEKSAILR